jgi:hypothetical protein
MAYNFFVSTHNSPASHLASACDVTPPDRMISKEPKAEQEETPSSLASKEQNTAAPERRPQGPTRRSRSPLNQPIH